MISLKELHIGYQSKHIAGPINEHLKKGQLVCLLGPNGTGKSTLVKTVAGLINPLEGKIDYQDKPIIELSSREKSKLLSVVLTEPIIIGNLTAYEIVELGRYPYKNWWGKNTEEDQTIVEEAIKSTGIEHLRDRKIAELSDGEKQKIMIARALAQNTDYILLDEPTSHLDLPSKIEVMTLLRQLVMQWDKSILVSTHDLNLAIQTSDKFWLIDKHGKFQSGINEDLILNGQLNDCFGLKDSTYSFSTGKVKMPELKKLSVEINSVGSTAKWTKHALERLGYSFEKDSKIKISITPDKMWSLQFGSNHISVSSIEELIENLTNIE